MLPPRYVQASRENLLRGLPGPSRDNPPRAAGGNKVKDPRSAELSLPSPPRRSCPHHRGLYLWPDPAYLTADSCKLLHHMGGSTPLAPYVDPESGLLVQSLDAAQAMRLIDTMPCLVHLLPQFRLAAITKFAQGGESDVFLSGCCPSGEGSRATRNGMVLYR